MSKNILIINSHPDKLSFNYALSSRYEKGAKEAGAKVNVLNLTELDFNPFFNAVENEIELEHDIKNAQELLYKSDHIVFFFPIWWASMPALLKAFLERVLVPNLSYNAVKNERSFIKWNEILSGKTARIIATMDAPPSYYILKVKQPAFYTMKDILKFCGIKKISKTYFGSVSQSTVQTRERWLAKTENLGKLLK